MRNRSSGLAAVITLRDAFYDKPSRSSAAAYSSAHLSFIIALAGPDRRVGGQRRHDPDVRRRVCKPIVDSPPP